MPALADRIKDTSTTLGIGDVTVSGTPPSTYFALSSLATGTPVDYIIEHQTLDEIEVGRGKIGASNTLTRDQPLRSSNSNALVNFSSGTKNVFVTVAGASIFSRGKALGMPYALR